jgi:hypothetical protein
MPTLLPTPLDLLRQRTPVAADLSAAQWANVELGVRERAFFSAHVENIGFLARARQLGEKLAQAQIGRTGARDELKAFLGVLGVPMDETDLTNLGSEARLNLILDTPLAQAQGYGRYLAEQEPDALDAFPAWELVRDTPAEEPRDWLARWVAAGGEFFGGDSRMIALKTDGIWARLSRFGTPFTPLDFNSGMGFRSIDRLEAQERGLIAPGEKLTPSVVGFNDTLQASIPDATPEMLDGFQAVFGDQVDVRGGKIVWRGQRIRDTYVAALADPQFKRTLDLGRATDTTLRLAREAGVELKPEAVLKLDADHIRKVWKDHGPQGEKRGDQRPLESLDFELLPHVWRDPDAVRAGDTPGDLIFEKSIIGRTAMVTWRPAPKTGAVNLQTLYVKKQEGGTP